ncbi:RHS repeat-associated core domain-containing protein [Nonomuraea sp. NPDC050404]|uniref:RHS repeat-associated core domain-containing protein n=1 Tax=Nonomuraea sp. NPDC050404 TaxID=3155783 RepID=UPI0033E69D9F
MSGSSRVSLRFRVITVAALMLAGLVVAPVEAVAAQPPLDWKAAADRLDTGGNPPASPPMEQPRSAQPIRSDRAPAAPSRNLPAAASAEVTLGAAAVARRAQGTPVELAAAGPAATGRRLRVEVLDETAAARAGAPGMVFRVSGQGGAPLGETALPVSLSIDYSAFAERFGGGYAGRLRLVALPPCALEDPVPAGCAARATVVPSRNERAASRLTASVPDLTALTPPAAPPAAGAPARAPARDARAAVLAVMAAPEGEEGSYKATPLSLSGDWQVSTGSGEFAYTYDVPEPKAPAGPTPKVGLRYSSGAVDGLVSGKNTQGGPVGVGWADLADSFVERRYNSCLDDGQVYADLCWKSANATISLNGHAAELVPMAGTSPPQWRLKNDPRWKVEQLTGADNGDADGEHWKVTTPDGVQYFFGRGVNPDTGRRTDSVWTVPVFGDDAGEPCHTATPVPWCAQAWRWNLDLVIDPHDNVQQWEYSREIGHYAALNGWPGLEHTEYVRAGALKAISYGQRRAAGETAPAAKVEYTTRYRCLNLDDECPAPTAATAASYPDTPVDLMCFTAVCTQHSPTFFTALRYSQITTYVDDNGFVKIDTVRLAHGLPDPDPNRPGDRKLYLNSVQRTGHSVPTPLTLPPVTFWPVALANRADTAGGAAAMPHYRIAIVTNEYGGEIHVAYGRPHPCPAALPDPPNWHLNTRDCFSHWHAPEGGAAGFAVFHKYLVTRVEQRDPLGGGPAMATTYQYGDQVQAGLPGAAWHHDRDEFTPNARQTWSEWRGYADVQVTQGTSRTRYRLFRGMNGDRLAGDAFPGPGSRVVTTSSLDGTVTGARDENWLAGQILDEQSPRANGTVESGAVRGYHAHRTVDAAGPDPLDDAWFVAPADTVSRLRDPATGGFLRKRTQTVYNGLLGTPDRLIEHGWTHVTGDERCTWTVPVVNADRWMLDFPASVTRYAGTTCEGAEVAKEEYAYDGGAFGVAPATKGDRTGSRVKLTSAGAWATTATTYDPLGRPLQETDPNGNRTRTSYTPGIGHPATTTVTNHLGHVTTTAWFRPRQAPAIETDPRGKRTVIGYDALGRIDTVHLPTEQGAGAPASYQFGYVIDPNKVKPTAVRTRRLQDTAGGTPRYLDTWTVQDGWLRERQDHTLSPEAGRVIVSDTAYDDRGLVAAVTQPQALPGAAGQNVLPAPSGGWANEVAVAYDELRRPVWEISRAAGAYRRSVVVDYTHDTIRTTPDPPAGGVVRTTKDAYDRTVRIEELEGTAWRPTVYGYDVADRLVSVRDPAGNTITGTYDLGGRRVAMNDPDMGSWTYAYDAAGNQTRATTATGSQVHTRYDALNRVTERRRDSATGPLLASWAYDASGERGLPDSSTRHDSSGEWVVDVTGYDDRGRPAGRTWTVPNGVDGLSGSYTVGYGYDGADHRTRITYPAVGGLPAETVTTGYNALGLAETMTGAEEYVWGANYDNRMRPAWLLSGSRAVPFSRVFDYDADQRLSRLRAGGGSSVSQDVRLAYDVTTGDVVERDTTLNGQSWRECFGHDERRRLTRAYTTAGACAGGAPGTGPNPYDHTYAYSTDGNLTRRVEGATTVAYTYPAAGSARPHAPTAAGSGAYTWNANGDLATRTTAGKTETFTWNAERLLTKIDDPGGDTSFVYDADGTRLLRRGPSGTTLYIEDHEITRSASAPALTATGGTKAIRTYSFASMTTAVRGSGGVEYLATDNQGSIQLTVPSGATTPSQARSYQPYGKPRSTAATGTDRGWIGQIEDEGTGLNHLNARYYDPVLARFISPDPLADLTEPQSLNPYAYGRNDPASLSDPAGLQAQDDELTDQEVIDAFICAGGGCAIEAADPTEAVLIDEYCAMAGEPCHALTPAHAIGMIAAIAAPLAALAEIFVGDWVDCATGGDLWSSACGWSLLDLIPVRRIVDAIGVLTSARPAANAVEEGAQAADEVAAADEAAELRPYGGPGGGHHIPAKSAFEGAPNYAENAAPAMPRSELARLGLSHGRITGAQHTLYRQHFATGKPLTWSIMARIETEALTLQGMPEGMARATVDKAIAMLQEAGVSGPTRVPWSR